MMSTEEQQRMRRRVIRSRFWAKRRAEVQERLTQIKLEEHVLMGLLRSIESEESKAKEAK